MRPFKSAFTWAAVVGETWPDRLADGATMGLPNVRSRSVCHAVLWPAQADRIEPRRGEIRYAAVGLLRQDQRERPRPKCLRQQFSHRVEHRQPSRRIKPGNMSNERIERRPALGRIETRDRLPVGGVGAEPVDRLGRKRDQPTGGEGARRLGYRLVSGDDDARARLSDHARRFAWRGRFARCLGATFNQSRLRSCSRF